MLFLKSMLEIRMFKKVKILLVGLTTVSHCSISQSTPVSHTGHRCSPQDDSVKILAA